MAHAQLNQLEPAIGFFTQAIDKQKTEAELFVTRAMLYARDKKFELAQQDINSALKLNPTHHSAYIVRAKIEFAGKKFQTVIDQTTEMLKLWPDDIEALLLRGQSYDILGLYELGIMDFDVAEQIEPDNPDIYFQRAVAHMDNNCLLYTSPSPRDA